MKIVFYLFLLIQIFPFVNSLEINEIMYDPEGNDNNLEFVELIHKANLNLTNRMIHDSSSNDTLTLMKWVNYSNYSLIVEEGFNYSHYNCTIYSAGSSIGNGLNNNQDTFCINNNSSKLCTNYTNRYANNNGFSLEKVNDIWVESNKKGGSPCLENPNQKVIKNSTKNSSNDLFCDAKIFFYIENNIIKEEEKLIFKPIINHSNLEYEITYWIEDLEGKIIKEKIITTNTNKKTWTPKDFPKTYILKGSIKVLNCIDNNEQNNYDKKLFATIQEKKSNINLKISPKKKSYSFGQKVLSEAKIENLGKDKLEIQIYIKSFSEKVISDIFSIKISDSTGKLDIETPILIPKNCDKSYEPGIYELVIESKNRLAKETILIKENPECPKSTEIKQINSKIKNIYVRSKKYSNTTKLYYSIDDFTKSVQLRIKTIDETYSFYPDSKNSFLNVSLRPNNNFVITELIINDTILDTRTIEIFLEADTNKIIISNNKTNTLKDNKTINTTNKISTMAIYKNTSKSYDFKQTEFLHLALVCLFSVVSAIPLIWWKKFRKLFKFS